MLLNVFCRRNRVLKFRGKNMNNKISIIIPVYNTKQEYLEECFKSIDEQTYENYEVVIVDDGSKDETAKFLDNYNKKEKYKILHKKNEGVSTARNYGIENSIGDWLLFVDSDDFLSKDALEKLIDKSENVDIVIGGVKRTNIDKIVEFETHILENEKKDELIKSIFQAKSARYFYVDGLWGKLYKKDFWNKSNLRLEKDLKFGEDATLNIEAYIKSKKICIFSDIVYYWRTNDESVTAKYNPRLMDEQEKVLNTIKRKFPLIVDEKNKKEFISYISRTLKNVIENIYVSNETSEKEKRNLVKKLIEKPIYKECIKSNLYDEVPLKRKIILFSLKFKLFFMIEILFKMYKKVK